ncbi:MAG: hypothetical protein O9330_09950 [Beijerinckiaceae bacterium]|nr:hypothetical protein [Beijerinckiaceae bacterium]
MKRNTNTDNARAKHNDICVNGLFRVAETQISCLCSEILARSRARFPQGTANGMCITIARKQNYIDKMTENFLNTKTGIRA